MKFLREFIMVMLFLPVGSYADTDVKPMTDGDIRDAIIRGMISDFQGECPCPYSRDKKNRICGENSEYFKTDGGVTCYHRDISASAIELYREEYGISKTQSPWEINRKDNY